MLDVHTQKMIDGFLLQFFFFVRKKEEKKRIEAKNHLSFFQLFDFFFLQVSWMRIYYLPFFVIYICFNRDWIYNF